MNLALGKQVLDPSAAGLVEIVGKKRRIPGGYVIDVKVVGGYNAGLRYSAVVDNLKPAN